ncbi:unnamed protein product [Closterium sp. NIES-53]
MGQRALIMERLTAFWEGRWREQFDSAILAARPAVRPLTYTSSHQDPDAIRLARCRTRCKVGEWSRGLACLIAGELTRPSEAMVQSLRGKHPTSVGKIPEWVRTLDIDAPQRPVLMVDILARAIHIAARASAAGPSGWLTEHLRDTFLIEPTILVHLLEVFNQWVAGQVPERARPWLAASNQVGLSKPNGDIRPVAIGEVLPDLYLRAGPFVETLASARGSRQGDPLGPFLFEFTQQLVMEPVASEFADLLFLSYADDTYILGLAARLLEAFGVLRKRLQVEMPLGMQRVEEGLTVLGVPIGAEDWEVARLQERLWQLQTPLPWLPLLDHPQMASHLLAIAVSMRPMYLAWTVPPRPEVVDAFSDWDNSLEDSTARGCTPGDVEPAYLRPPPPPPPVRLFQARLRLLAVEELQAVRRLARDDATLACFTSLRGPGAGAWVSAAEWSIAAAVRLGLPIQQLHVAGRCVCGTVYADPADPHHALRCKYQHGPSRVHDEVKFEVTKISKASGGVVTMEDDMLLPGKRVDVAVHRPIDGEAHALEINVADPLSLSPSLVRQCERSVGVAAKEWERRKANV